MGDPCPHKARTVIALPISPGGRPPDPRLSGCARRYQWPHVGYPTSVLTAAVISASAFFASAKYMLVLELT